MSRTKRVIVAGEPHHLTQRGNRGASVFFSSDDRQRYLVWLADYCERYGLKVWAYCLMTNHIHIIAVPESADSVGKVMRTLQMRHALRTNMSENTRGHLWEGRYHSTLLDPAHLWEAVRHVERNPVTAGLVAKAEDYPWSSAAAHCNLRADPLPAPDLPLPSSVDNWSEWLSEPVKEEFVALLRRRTEKGIPCGDDAFLRKVGRKLGIDIQERPRGRPRKNAAAK